jgi:hypothetical protein
VRECVPVLKSFEASNDLNSIGEVIQICCVVAELE